MKTLDEISQEVKEIEKKLRQEVDEVLRKFTQELLFKNNPYPVGSIIEDHSRIMKVDKIKYSFYHPSCVYEGVELTQKLQPKKRQTGTRMWQCNVLKVHYSPEN